MKGNFLYTWSDLREPNSFKKHAASLWLFCQGKSHVFNNQAKLQLKFRILKLEYILKTVEIFPTSGKKQE